MVLVSRRTHTTVSLSVLSPHLFFTSAPTMTITSTTTRAAAAVRGASVTARKKTTSFNCIAKRWQHNKSFSSYEYPNRQEAPTVTRTTAADAAATAAGQEMNKDAKFSFTEEDHFDDAGTMSYLESMARRQQQKQWISTNVQNSRPILKEPPSFIPPNVGIDKLTTPQTEISTLLNGIRVVSQETYGQVSTVGVLAGVGSRHETKKQTGVTNLLELLAFNSTKQETALSITEKLQDWGGVSFCNTGREQTLHCIDVLRPNTQKAMNLLAQVLLEPQFLDEEVEECKRAIEFQNMDIMPEIVLGEALQRAAYGPNQQLGQPHFCKYYTMCNNGNKKSIYCFYNSHIFILYVIIQAHSNRFLT